MNHGDTEALRGRLNELSSKVIGACIEIHRELGPGLLESAYEECLSYSLSQLNLEFKRQVPMPVRFRTVLLDCGYRLDLVVEDLLVVELKAVTEMHPVFEAQLVTYLKLARKPLGLLINFNVPMLKEGVKRNALGRTISETFHISMIERSHAHRTFSSSLCLCASVVICFTASPSVSHV